MHPGRDSQGGGLARAVRAEQGHHLARGDAQVHAVQYGDPVVGGAHLTQLQQDIHSASPTSPR
jgi:hypothetical protein